MHPRLSHPLYELERTISHSNLLYTSIEMKKKYLESLQIVIAENVSITCTSISAIYLTALFARLFLIY